MSKQTIRQRLLIQRQQLDASSCARQSATVQEHVLTSTVYAEAVLLALYAPIRNEVQTQRILSAALLAGKRVCYPRLENGRIVFVEVSGQHDLQPGKFGVPEPQGKIAVSPEELDLILVPGVAFDCKGGRIGYGSGYYDRILAVCANARFFGLAYTFQLIEKIPEEKHDIRLDFLATEGEMIEFKHKQLHLMSGGRI